MSKETSFSLMDSLVTGEMENDKVEMTSVLDEPDSNMEDILSSVHLINLENSGKPIMVNDYQPHNVIDYSKIDNADKYPFGKIYLDKPQAFESLTKNVKWYAYRDSRLERERKVKFNLCTDNTLPSTAISNHRKCFLPNCTGVIKKVSNTFYGRCDMCKAIGYFFSPTPMQQHFINNYTSNILLSVGAFGSGKTVGSAAKVAMHLISIPNSYVLGLAQTLEQLQAVARPELMKFIPDELIVKDTQFELVLRNGAKVEWLSSDNENKLRGRNATMAWVVEFNTIKHDVIDQLEKRVRNPNGFVYEYDENGKMVMEEDSKGQLVPKVIASYNQIILETNPDPSSKSLSIQWKRSTEFVGTKSVRNPLEYEQYLLPRVSGTKSVCTYLTSTIDNPFVSQEYIKSNQAATGQSYDLFVKVNLAMEEGLVYTNFNKAILEPDKFPNILPVKWPRVYGADFGGGHAPTTMVCGAIYIPELYTSTPDMLMRIPNFDDTKPALFIYKDYKKVSSSIADHIPEFNKMIYGNTNQVGSGVHTTSWSILDIVADPSGVRKNEGSAVSVIEQYRNAGIPFKQGYNNKQGSVADMGGLAICNDLFGNQVFISSECNDLIQEGRNLHYEYKIAKGSDTEGYALNKYEAGSRDDVLDAMRYAIVRFYFWLKDRDDLPMYSSNQQHKSDELNQIHINDDGTWSIESEQSQNGNNIRMYNEDKKHDNIMINMPMVDLND